MSSVMEFHPLFQAVIKLLGMRKMLISMSKYGGPTDKKTYLYSRDSFVLSNIVFCLFKSWWKVAGVCNIMFGSHWFCLLRPCWNRLHCWARGPAQVTTTGDGTSLLQWWGPAAIYWRPSFKSIPSLSSRVPLLNCCGMNQKGVHFWGNFNISLFPRARSTFRKVVDSNFVANINTPLFQRFWFTLISIGPTKWYHLFWNLFGIWFTLTCWLHFRNSWG